MKIHLSHLSFLLRFTCRLLYTAHTSVTDRQHNIAYFNEIQSAYISLTQYLCPNGRRDIGATRSLHVTDKASRERGERGFRRARREIAFN